MYGDQFGGQYGQFGGGSKFGGNLPGGGGQSAKMGAPQLAKSGKGCKVAANHFNKSGLATIYSKKHDEIDFGFGSKSVRIGFMRKIYIILTVQLLICFGLVYFASIS